MKHESGVLTVAVSADGMRLVTGSTDGTARLWDCAWRRTNRQGGKTRIRGADAPRSVRTERAVVTGGSDGTARLWDGNTGVGLGEVMKHEGWVRKLAFSPDGTRIVTGSDDFTARLWNAHTGAPVGEAMRHQSDVTCVAFSTDGTIVATGDSGKPSGGMVRLWDARARAPRLES